MPTTTLVTVNVLVVGFLALVTVIDWVVKTFVSRTSVDGADDVVNSGDESVAVHVVPVGALTVAVV